MLTKMKGGFDSVLLAGLFAAFLTAFFPMEAHAREELSIIVTSNLEGRFSLEEAGQDGSDPLLLLAQSITAERRRNRTDLYIDLGNSFYPGPLSKFSYGSIMMDYFNYLSCDAMLVSSKDLRIGVDNLQFLQSGKRTALVSSNIHRDKKPVFAPHFVRTKGAHRVAFVGVSSGKIRFDIAEKNLYKIQLRKEYDALAETLKDLEGDGATHVVLLSGLGIRETVALMGSFPRVRLALCGGDNTGEVYSLKASRLDLADGRSVLLLPEGGGYYAVILQLDGALSLGAIRRVESAAGRTDAPEYREFANRLALWKRKFRAEEDAVIADAGEKVYVVNDTKLLGLLRDRYNTELSVVDKNTLTESSLKDGIKRSDLLNMVNLDYNIFTSTLRGDEVKRLIGKDESLIIDGTANDRIQGYLIEAGRRYRVAATQSAFERMGQILEKEIPYRNEWVNVTDTMLADIKGDKILFKDNYKYIDRFFRMTVDFYLSNFIENSRVNRGENIETPPGQSETSYRQWGLENQIDISVYNRYHRFILTPFMLYVRQDQQYLNNLLRGTFIYNLNLHDIIKPYHKSQAETVVKDVDGLRPVVVRETAGINAETKVFTARLGGGFEKKVNDPVEAPVYGLEALVNVKYPFLSYFTYKLSVDTFLSAQEMRRDERHLRSEVSNSISVSVNRYLSVSLKHRWFYLRSGEYREKYENSQVITSADLRTDFKVW